jgi:acylphosphatase
LKLRFPFTDLILAWLVATIFSGLPSTLYALASGADPLEATRAAGTMLTPGATDTATLIAAAALVHPAVSLFWTALFGFLLPRRQVALWAIGGAAAVALLDLRVIAPSFFPSVAALPFWPQFADHLMWGALLGGTLQLRQHRAALKFGFTMANDAPIETRLVRVRGRVQGVGYRYACVQQASSLGITGWVRNRMDDSVEAMLQGTPAQLDRMCQWMRDDVPTAIVEDIEIAQIPPPFTRFDRFEQRPTQ